MARDESPSTFLLLRGRICLVRHQPTTTHPARPAKSPDRVVACCAKRPPGGGVATTPLPRAPVAPPEAERGSRPGGVAHAHPRRRCTTSMP
jgi:hypothetical protein